MNYPHDCVELLLFADNCSDNTYAECLSVQAMPEYAGRNLTIIDRTGTGGKAGVLNDALKMARGNTSVSMMRMPCLKKMLFISLSKK